MENEITCFTSEFIDIDFLTSILNVKPFLSTYTDAFCEDSLQYKNVSCEEYMGFKIPLTKIESVLNETNNSIVVISKQPLNIPFFKLEEAIMHNFPRFSFLLRNSTIEYQGTDILLNSKYGCILFVSLYNTQNHVVTIPIK